MKNTNVKINKIKLVSRVMPIIIVLSTLILSGCSIILGDVDWVVHQMNFETNYDFVKFIQKYNSKSDYSASSFISFDFDNLNENIEKEYFFRTRAPYRAKDLYDKNTIDTNLELFFYLDKYKDNNEAAEINYKVKCCYSKLEKILFYTDNFEIKILNKTEMLEMSGYYMIYDNDYQDERFSSDEKNKYSNAYSLALLVNGQCVMSIKISSSSELQKKQLEDISQIMLDNIVIVCAGDNKNEDVDNTTEDNLEIIFGSHIPTNEPQIFQSQYYATHYFNKLISNYGNNHIGSCSYVALSMLLSYYDSYWNDNIVANNENDDIYDKSALFITTDLLCNTVSPGIRSDKQLSENELLLVNYNKSEDEKQNKLTPPSIL